MSEACVCPLHFRITERVLHSGVSGLGATYSTHRPLKLTLSINILMNPYRRSDGTSHTR